MQKIIVEVNEEKEEFLTSLTEECYVLHSTLSVEYVRKFTNFAQSQKKLVLFCGDEAISRLKVNDADGVLLDLGSIGLKDKVEEIRKSIGKNKILGLVSRTKRHDSMLVAETEPDFVVFKAWSDGIENLVELTDWYADFFIIPCAIFLQDDNVDYQNIKSDYVIKK